MFSNDELEQLAVILLARLDQCSEGIHSGPRTLPDIAGWIKSFNQAAELYKKVAAVLYKFP